MARDHYLIRLILGMQLFIMLILAGCSKGGEGDVPADYSLSLDSSSISISQGGFARVSLTANSHVDGNIDEYVELKLVSCPQELSCSLWNTYIFEGWATQLQVSTTTSTPAGTYSVVVKGTEVAHGGTPFVFTSGGTARATLNVTVVHQSNSISFSTKGYDIGGNPYLILSSDLNNDLFQDLVVLNYHDPNGISILLNDGAGGISSSTNVTGADPHDVKVADFNNDNIPDLCFANYQGSTVSVLMGDGTGEFDNRTEYQVPEEPDILALGNVNSDSSIDIVLYHSDFYGTITPLAGSDSGTFTALSHSEIGNIVNPRSFTLADINGDNNLDITIADSLSRIISIPGDGYGNFLNGAEINLPFEPYGMVMGDLNGDAIVDLVVTDYETRYGMYVFLGDGSGNFTLTYSTEVPWYNPSFMLIADFDNDLNSDIAFVNNTINAITIIRGNGDGTLGGISNYASTSFHTRIASSDMNNDGKLDIVATSLSNMNVSIYLQQ